MGESNVCINTQYPDKSVVTLFDLLNVFLELSLISLFHIKKTL